MIDGDERNLVSDLGLDQAQFRFGHSSLGVENEVDSLFAEVILALLGVEVLLRKVQRQPARGQLKLRLLELMNGVCQPRLFVIGRKQRSPPRHSFVRPEFHAESRASSMSG